MTSREDILKMVGAGKGHVHLTGICGIGMAGLALLLKSRGLKVSGCDLSVSPISGWLRARGMSVAASHDPSHISRGVKWVVRSSAVPSDAPEITAAAEMEVPVFKRGETLAALLEGVESVAVAGTHGKTTTTGLITQVLRSCGCHPSFCIGGEIPVLGGVAGIGSGKTLVVEADESDGTLSCYAPGCAVITNIEPDHMEHFGSMDALRRCFGDLVKKTTGSVIYCADDLEAAALCKGLLKSTSYGFSRTADVRGTCVEMESESSTFTVAQNGESLGKIRLPLPGRHNIENALAAIAVALGKGLEFGRISRALSKVELPRRRFEKAVCTGELLVISDYGHHPSEISVLVAAAKRLASSRGHAASPRIRAVFQPHRYSRTLALGPHFPGAFSGINEVVLVPVYAASEKVVSGGSIFDLYSEWRIQKTGARAHGKKVGIPGSKTMWAANLSGIQPPGRRPSVPPVLLAGSLDQAWQYFRRTQCKGDTLLVVGAGDVERIAGWAKTECAEEGKKAARRKRRPAGVLSGLDLEDTVIRFDESLARKTTFRVGGTADIWMEIGTTGDLRKVIRYAARHDLPFRIVGGGSNVLASDLGVRGITARLTGAVFKRIESDRKTVVAGAGVALARLLTWLEQNGWAGLEFLEGIPGTVGGALRMNAGAWGDEIGKHVSLVRSVDQAGAVRVLRQPEFAYRKGVSSPGIIEAVFNLNMGGKPQTIKRRRTEIAAKRTWMNGLHCAGSVFRNPPGDFAGRLIEKAGLKGAVVGGAAISTRHANVIVTGQKACASDVLALIGKVKTEVKLKFGIDLESEVVILQ